MEEKKVCMEVLGECLEYLQESYEKDDHVVLYLERMRELYAAFLLMTKVI